MKMRVGEGGWGGGWGEEQQNQSPKACIYVHWNKVDCMGTAVHRLSLQFVHPQSIPKKGADPNRFVSKNMVVECGLPHQSPYGLQRIISAFQDFELLNSHFSCGAFKPFVWC